MSVIIVHGRSNYLLLKKSMFDAVLMGYGFLDLR